MINMLKVERMVREKLVLEKNLHHQIGFGLEMIYRKTQMGHIGVFEILVDGESVLSLNIDSAKGLRDALTLMLEEEK